MGSIKMVVVDIVRTLLRSDDTISDYTMGVLNSLKEKNVVFVALTMRSARWMLHFYPHLPWNFAIFHNGAMVMEKDKLLFSAGIGNIYELVTRMLESEHYDLAAEVNNRLYANFEATCIWPKSLFFKTEDFHEVRGMDAYKLIIDANPVDRIARFRRFLPEDCYLLLAEDSTALIMNKKANRLLAVCKVAERLGIPLEDVAVFGSDYCDLGVMRFCGHTIAVEDGTEYIKSVANHICGTGDEDGVAKWLEAHI